MFTEHRFALATDQQERDQKMQLYRMLSRKNIIYLIVFPYLLSSIKLSLVVLAHHTSQSLEQASTTRKNYQDTSVPIVKDSNFFANKNNEGNGQLKDNQTSILSENLNDKFIRHEISDFIQPTKYTLRISADPCRERFHGQLLISVNMTSMPSEDGIRFISLHAGASIKIRQAFFIQSDNTEIQASALGRDSSNEIITIDFQPNFITDTSGHLILVYSGKIYEERVGLFRTRGGSSSPTVANGSSKQNYVSEGKNQTSSPAISGSVCKNDQDRDDFGLATHFQPNDARRVFPCWVS